MSCFTTTIRELMNQKINIFDFDYKFYSNHHKKDFEEKFINKFYLREIGQETIEEFKHHLKCMLQICYPKYEHLYKTTIQKYNLLENYNVEETITTDMENESSGFGKGSQFDTPITTLTPNEYKKSPSHISESDTQGKNKGKSTMNRTTKGNIGVQTAQDLIMKERAIIINLDEMILKELSILFMGVFDC